MKNSIFLSNNVRKNEFRKDSKHYYFDFILKNISHFCSVVASGRTRKKGGTVLRSTLNWKSDATSIDQFLIDTASVSESFHSSPPTLRNGARVKGQYRKITLLFNIDILPLGRCEPALAGYRIELILAQRELNHVSGTNGI